MNRISPLELDPLETTKQLNKAHFLNNLSNSSNSESSDNDILQTGCGCCCCAPGTTFSTFCPNNLTNNCVSSGKNNLKFCKN